MTCVLPNQLFAINLHCAMKINKPDFDYQRHQAIVWGALPCKHQNRTVRHKRDTKGVIRLREQCPDCGKAVSGELRHSVLNGVAPESVPPWDYVAEQQFLDIYLSLSSAVSRIINQERSDEWWTQYGNYLASPEWHAIRRKIIDASRGICEYCRTSPAVQVHHKTYDRVGQERMEDLSAVCLKCHQQLHSSSESGK